LSNPSTYNKTAFSEVLRSGKPVLLDGGLSNELEALGMDLNNSLWSASILKNNQDAIIKAHLNYLRAGADIIITSSYQASEMGFEAVGLAQDQAQALIIKSVELAQTAVEEFMRAHSLAGYNPPLIAASIGPYGAAMADGSEYHGNYGITSDVLKCFHLSRLSLLDGTEADILACETIPSMQEARVLHDLLLNANTPAWVCFSCKDGERVSDGTKIEQLAMLFKDHPKVIAIGINCTPPQYVNELIGRIKSAAPDKAIIAYPNSGERYDAYTKTWHGTVEPLSCGLAAKSWCDAGAIIIGGCCRMGPEHIKAMKEQSLG